MEPNFRRNAKLTSILSLAVIALLAPYARADALNFYNNWFVTGDYTVAGVGLLNTGGVGAITMNGVPCTLGVGQAAAIVPCSTQGALQAYPVAAFLYWQTVETSSTAAGANGTFDGNPITGTLVGSDSSSNCFISASR